MRCISNNLSKKKENDIISRRLDKLQRNVLINNPELYKVQHYEKCLGNLLIDTLSRTEVAHCRSFDNLDCANYFITYLAVNRCNWILNKCRMNRRRLMIEVLKKPLEQIGANILIDLSKSER